MKNNVELYTLHLFAGVGGGILGDILNGHRPIGAVEIEKYARKVLLQRQLDGILPKFPIWDNISTFREDNISCSAFFQRLYSIRNRLCIAGGFPCQGMSPAGEGRGFNDPRSALWFEMLRVVREIQPAYIFIENSDRLKKKGLDVILGSLSELGYNAKWGVLGSSDMGGHCRRKRLWIVASSSEVGWMQMVCSKQNISRGSGGEAPINGYPRSRTERIRTLESLVGEPAILGSNDGLANRVDRLHATGNGQHAQLAATAWNILKH